MATESEHEGGILGRRVCLLREKISEFINLSRRGEGVSPGSIKERGVVPLRRSRILPRVGVHE